MKKIVIAVVALVVIAAYSQRSEISQRILARGAEMAMTANWVAELDDGIHVSLCGAGGPLPDPNRSGPCVSIVAGKQLFVIDAGTNGVRNLLAMRYPVGEIASVFLTHFHSDHIDGLGELSTLRWVNGNNTVPLPIVGPEGVQEVVAGFNAVYAQDTVYRNDHHGDAVTPVSGAGMTATPFALPKVGELVTVYQEGDLKVQALAVDHAPVSPAVGYLFTYKDRTVLVSGDTSQSTNITHFAKGVDLLVHEALAAHLVGIMNATAEKTGNAAIAKITADIIDYHATPIEAAETARDADVGHLLFYHIVPPLIVPGTEAAWLEGVDEIFSDYTLGQDGTSFSLPSGSKEIIRTKKSL